MRLLVCGGRNYYNAYWVGTLLRLFGPSVVIHGAAGGADELAACWACDNRVAWLSYPPDWRTHGKAAGPIRNTRMLAEGKPDMVLAFPGGRGTANMIAQARAAGVPTIEVPDAP